MIIIFYLLSYSFPQLWFPIQTFARTIPQTCDAAQFGYETFNNSSAWPSTSLPDVGCQLEQLHALQKRAPPVEVLDSLQSGRVLDLSNLEFYDEYQQLASKGYSLRVMPIPNSDISQTGSSLISNAAANYELEIQPTRYDPVKIASGIIGGAPFLDVFTALGRKPPPSLLSIFVKNPAGKTNKLKESTPYGFSTSSDIGLLVVHFAYKEKDAGYPREELFSEIMFRAWYEEVKASTEGPQDQPRLGGLKRLGYIIHEDVENKQTQKVIDLAIEMLPQNIRQVKGDEKVGTQPGFLLTLNLDSDNIIEQEAFNAILGSANGRGVAYMLNQHSQGLSGKTVLQVKVFFYASGADNPSILFRIGRLRLPQENRVPPRLPYDWARARSIPQTLDSLGRSSNEGYESGYPEGRRDFWESESLGSGTSEIGGPGEFGYSGIITDKNITTKPPKENWVRRLHRRADTSSNEDGSDEPSFEGDIFFDAVEHGKKLSKISYKPDVSPSGSTIIMNRDHYKLEYREASIDPDARAETMYLIDLLYGHAEKKIDRTGDKTEDVKKPLQNKNKLEELSVVKSMPGVPESLIYKFQFLMDKGALIVKEIDLTGNTGSQTETSISEVFFRAWYEVVTAGMFPAPAGIGLALRIRTLRMVIIEDIQDFRTTSVVQGVSELMEGAPLDEPESKEDYKNRLEIERISQVGFDGSAIILKIWAPGTQDTEDVADSLSALIGCESGKSVAKMLQDHSEILGEILIEEVVLLESNNGNGPKSYHLGYLLGRDPPDDLEDHTHSPTKDHLRYESHVERGKNMRNRAIPAQREDLSPRGSELITQKTNGYTYSLGETPQLYKKGGSQSDFLISYYLLSREFGGVTGRIAEVGGGDPEDTKVAAYIIAHSREAGLLVIKMAFKGVDLAYPKEQKFSEILYRIWFDTVSEEPANSKTKLSDLRYIGADDILNRGFKEVARHVFRRHKSLRAETQVGDSDVQFLIFDESSETSELQESFDALLATVFGRAITRMLGDHANALGRKRVTRILVLRETPDEEDEEYEDSHRNERYRKDNYSMPPFYVLYQIEGPAPGDSGGPSRQKRGSNIPIQPGRKGNLMAKL
ncbi:hypothetical protein TWF718_001129 [Orbilia javanica]|uniref:Uncharacterized protein n=1 Tax=Orbilia javanica TaxID=47235 RepID=A0AAN8RN40_9PEZI